MHKLTALVLGSAVAVACASGPEPGSLDGAAEHLGVDSLNAVRISGSGASFAVGQPYRAGEEWPRFTIKSYEAVIDYANGAMRTDIVRTVPSPSPPGGGVRFEGEQRQIQLVNGDYAWNMPAAPPAGGGEPQAQPANAAAPLRSLQVWTTPHGFLRAARQQNATPATGEGGTELSFTLPSGHRVEGLINANNEVARVRTWVDNPVMGDTPVETTYSDYREFNGIRFPTRIQETTGGHPSVELTVDTVEANPQVDTAVPENVRNAPAPAGVETSVDKVAEGVYYIRGGSHHSVAIEMNDHVVVVEGPQSDERAEAVIAAVQKTIPNKPIRFVVNTHVHFDHSGGLRPFVEEGATIVTHESNREFFEQALTTPRTLEDGPSASASKPIFQTVGERGELTDKTRTIELHTIQDNQHAVGFLMVYLPRERILIEADAYTPGPPNAPPPATPNPNTVALYDNVQRLKLNVNQILALHGPRVATMADLRAAAGQSAG